jgi:hypothetical protein
LFASAPSGDIRGAKTYVRLPDDSRPYFDQAYFKIMDRRIFMNVLEEEGHLEFQPTKGIQ